MQHGRIYVITNRVNGKQYVGQTVGSLDTRWRKHQAADSHCHALLAAIRAYGPNAFTIEEVARAGTQEQLNALEDQFVSSLNTLAPNGYNIKQGGGSKGKWTPEKRDELRRKTTAVRSTTASRQKSTLAQLARWTSEKERAKQSARLREVCADPDVRAVKSAAAKALWDNPVWREKMVAAMQNRGPMTAEHKAKMVESRRRRAAERQAQGQASTM